MKNNRLILILQNLVLFPNEEVRLELKNELSKKIVDEAISGYNSELLIVSPKDELEIRPSIKDLPRVATYAKIKSKILLPNDNVRINIRGIKRTEVLKYHNAGDFIEAEFASISSHIYNLDEEKLYIKKLQKVVKKYVSLSPTVSNTILDLIKNPSSLGKMCDIISATILSTYKERWILLVEDDYFERAKKLIQIINSEISDLELDQQLDEEIRSNFESNEKEILIKEKINVLSKQLSGKDRLTECEQYKQKINSLKIDSRIKGDMLIEVDRLLSTVDSSPEYGIVKAHLDFIVSLPWNKKTIDNKNIEEIDKSLNETHYGLEKAKDRIEEYLILKSQKRKVASPVLCLVGPPGTGKTTFARELAKSIGREFIKISVGGLSDSGELIGHRRTYIGAAPGKIIEGIKKSGVNNPIILIDEVDKMIKDYRGDPASVLLDILDPNQNREFIDNYVAEPFDLSNVLFILTANEKTGIPLPLLDRLELIDVHSYTLFDKLEIAKNYTLPRLGKEYDFDYKMISITDKAIIKIIECYTKEPGVRDLERHICSIVRKILIKNTFKTTTINDKDIVKYLGIPKYSTSFYDYHKSGIVNVPAVGEYGGCVLNIESVIYDGPNQVLSTGSLGEVMKESIIIADSYIKANAKTFKLDIKKLSGTIHIHALDGATKKEGPSAGLAIVVALLSTLTNKVISQELAFTGEISLEGKILPVGGIKEKIISSYNAGIKMIFIPKDNEQDLIDIPKKVLNVIDVVCVSNFTEVYKEVFN